jgi:hypothetical protein
MKTEKRCFVACSKDKIDRGQCSCNNRIMGAYYPSFNLSDVRIIKIEKILNKI